MRDPFSAALVAITLVMLGGCEGETARDPAMDPRTPPGIPETGPPEVAATSPQEVTLRELQGSGIRGSAVLTPADTVVRVQLAIEGSRSGASHAARIYAGSCEAPGAVLAELDPILVDGPRTVVPRMVQQRPMQLLGGQSALMVYPSGGVIAGPGAACGNIPRHPQLAPAPEGTVTEPPVLPAEPPAADG
jgi:hypothetical protein